MHSFRQRSDLPQIPPGSYYDIRADFVLILDHEGGKGLLSHRNKVAVFNRDGDDIFNDSTRELGNSVKDACSTMLRARK